MHNIRIALVMVETWTSGDRIEVAHNAEITLSNFADYKHDVLDFNEDTKNHDSAHFLS